MVGYRLGIGKNIVDTIDKNIEQLESPTVRALGVRSWKISNVHKGQSSDG
jgi:hypothetical protein